MPKTLEMVHFGYHTGIRGLVLCFGSGFFWSTLVPVGYLCVHNYLGSQTAYL